MKDKKTVDEIVRKVHAISLGDKKALWLSEHNKYLLVTPPTDEIIRLLYTGEPQEKIIQYCTEEFALNQKEAFAFVSDIKNNFEKNLPQKKKRKQELVHSLEEMVTSFSAKHFYRFNRQVFCIEYETSEMEYYIHPKFADQEVYGTEKYDYLFRLFKHKNQYHLTVNGNLSGSWDENSQNFLSGKVSMEILQKITDTKEDDWMGVFHAAGVVCGNEGIMFLGDSGNGKSTLSAILMARGFKVLSDDFLPVFSESALMYSFPASISIKKRAVDLLAVDFPELKIANEYDLEMNKTVRFLPNSYSGDGEPKKVKCKGLVFVKYNPEKKLEVKALAKDSAFQKLVPDIWISPKEKNALQFLNWFEKLPCWQIEYSDNLAMIETVKSIFADELAGE